MPFKISYFASIESEENEIIYEVTGIPLSKLKIHYTFTSNEMDETEINCLLQLDSKLLGKQILMRKLEKAQNDLMSSLKKIFQK